MRLNIPKLFDKAPIANTQGGKDLDAFIDYVLNAFQQIITGLSGQLKLTDNFAAKELSVTLTHGVTLTVPGVKAVDVYTVLPVSVLNSTTVIDGFTCLAFSADNQGQLCLVPQFRLATTTARSCVVLVLYK